MDLMNSSDHLAMKRRQEARRRFAGYWTVDAREKKEMLELVEGRLKHEQIPD